MPQSYAALAVEFHRAAQVSRAALYGTNADPQLPLHLHADARIPFLGFCGPDFGRGGPVILAINPGGGGDSYARRTAQDSELIPLLQAFVEATPEEMPAAFERMCSSYAAHVQTWNLWRILRPTLEACNSSVDEICYLNLFPYRTANDARPSSRALNAAWIAVVAPLLKALQPSLLVALGKKSGGVAERFHREPPALFVVPRTIGDTYVSEDAKQVLAALRERAA